MSFFLLCSVKLYLYIKKTQFVKRNMVRKNKKRCIVTFSDNKKFAIIDGITYIKSWRREITPDRLTELKAKRTEYMRKYRVKCQQRLKRLEQIERQFNSDIPETGQPENVTV